MDIKQTLMTVHNIIHDMSPTGDDILKAAECIVQLRKVIEELDKADKAPEEEEAAE